MIKLKNSIIYDVMKEYNKSCCNIMEEGRMNSLWDEKSICNYLTTNEKTKFFIITERKRKAGDFLVKDTYDVPYNIKTTFGSTADNAFSKKGVVYSLTSLSYDQIPDSLDWIKMQKLISKYKCENTEDKDYYYFVCDKNDMCKCYIRGLRQINKLKSNPSNTFQIKWKDELKLPPSNRTFEEAYNYIIGVIKDSIKQDTDGKLFFYNGV